MQPCRPASEQCSFQASALHLAAYKGHEAVCKAWGDLTRRFPCRLYVVGGLDSGFQPASAVYRLDPALGEWECLPPLAAPMPAKVRALWATQSVSVLPPL